MNIDSYLREYLQKKNIKLKKVGQVLQLKCLFCGNEKSAIIPPKCEFVNCFSCEAKKKTIFDIVRKLENKDMSDEDVIQHIKETLNLNIVTKKDKDFIDEVLNFYKENKFDLVPVAKDKKFPIENDWTNKNHTDIEEWQRWLNDGINIGIKTGKKSNLTIIDVDVKPVPQEIMALVGDTFSVETSKGFHFYYKYVEDLPKTRINDLKIDLENDGGQVICLSGQTNIRTSEGWKFLKNIKIGDEVISYDFKNKKVQKSKVINKQKTKKDKVIRFYLKSPKTGKKITCSLDHEFFVRNKWIKAKNLKIGDEIYHLTITNQLITKASIKQGNTYRIGYIKGYADGDGYITSKNISFSSIDKDGIKRIQIYLNQLFNYNTKISYKINHRKNEKNSYLLQIANYEIVEFLKNYDNEDIDYIRGYLAGFYDAEGHSKTEPFGVQFTNTNIKLLLKIKKYLNLCGIKKTKIEKSIHNKFQWYNLIFFDNYKQVFSFYIMTKPAIIRKYPNWKYYAQHLQNGEKIIKKDLLIAKKGKFTLYDITVEPNHNFFANGLLTHNCSPSIVNGVQRKIKELKPILEMPNELYNYLKNKVTVPLKSFSEKLKEDITTENFNLNLLAEGERNASLIKLGGLLRKELNVQQTERVLNILNRHICSNPLTQKELNAMVKSLGKYSEFDEKELAHRVMVYLKDVEEAGRMEICSALMGTNRGEEKQRIDKVLNYLVKEQYVQKKGSRYILLQKMTWASSLIDTDNDIGFKIPYFHDIANIEWGDLILIGSKTKYGKTGIAMNIIKRLVEQDIAPFYISLESGSRFKRISLRLGLKEGDFYYNKKWIDPLGIQLEKKSIMIIDWLCPDNFAEVDKIFRHFTEQLAKTDSILIVFMQLKDRDGEYFSNNLVKQFPSLCVRYMYDNENDGTYGRFHIDAIRDPKTFIKTWDIPCKYDFETKILSRIDELESNLPKQIEEKPKDTEIKSEDLDISEEEISN